jgi:hypothetical protein
MRQVILNFRSFLIIFGMVITMVSCEKEDEEEGTNVTTPVSGSTNLGTSHNTGKNCLSCHKFSVGGSVYKQNLTSTFPGSVVKLTTQPNGLGTVVATLTTDNSGNIYKSSSISFGAGLYVSASGTTGTKYMASPVTSGACNSCHGGSTSKIWAE